MPLSVNVWTKVAVAVQTALAAAKTITVVTKANPAVATSTAHGFTNGQEVKLTVSGMLEINNMVVRVANITANTFELEGIDSTLFGTFTSGTAELITFGAAASTLQDVNSSGGEAKDIDITTIHDDTEKVIPGPKSPLAYSFGSLWDPADPALLELKKADRVKGTRSLKFTFASGAKIYFDAYPTASLAPGGSKGGPVTTPVSFKLTGPVTSYVS
jgi:Phage tail tube protein, TTP